jgi:hydroxyethylthiazole kinase-like uncharacterized protein yjeF
MQKLFLDCYEMDKRCYEKYGLTEDILMEHAANAMAEYIKTNFPKGDSILIVAGPGNNGADGITLARILNKSYRIYLYIPLGVKSQMAKLQLKRAKAVGVEGVNDIKECDITVDALFGAGLNRGLPNEIAMIVSQLNRLNSFKISCDIPTGIDTRGRVGSIAFRADVTVTMGALKEALYLDEAKDYVGNIICADLGVDRELYEMPSNSYLLEESDFNPPFRIKKSSHKGSFGHCAIFCGEKEGAGIISALSATRFGAGLTTLIVHDKVSPPPHIMHSTTIPKNTTAIAIGMGLGNFFEKEFLQKDVVDSNIPIVLDADALSNELLLSILYQKNREIVVTPHPKEFAKMWYILKDEKLTTQEIQKDRFEIAREFEANFPTVTLLLKGANTIIAKDKKRYVNPIGGANLSKGGSGDVLSGLIVSLLAQGYDSLFSAINGSLALTLSANRFDGNNYSLISSDLIDGLKYI